MQTSNQCDASTTSYRAAIAHRSGNGEPATVGFFGCNTVSKFGIVVLMDQHSIALLCFRNRPRKLMHSSMEDKNYVTSWRSRSAPSDLAAPAR